MNDRSSNSSDDGDSPLRIEQTYDDETPPSIAIIQAIATIENADPRDVPEETGITLYDYIDPDALDRLATGNTNSAAMTLDLGFHPDHQYTVQIRTGQLVVQKAG